MFGITGLFYLVAFALSNTGFIWLDSIFIEVIKIASSKNSEKETSGGYSDNVYHFCGKYLC